MFNFTIINNNTIKSNKGPNKPLQDEVIDSKHEGNWTKYMNHSTTPNVVPKQEMVNGKNNILFYTSRPIKAGEQLTYDYGTWTLRSVSINFKIINTFPMHPLV